MHIVQTSAPVGPLSVQGGTAPGAVGGGNEITFISWNRKVQHILASSTTNGTTVVWDLKRQKPVISLRDPNRCALRSRKDSAAMGSCSMCIQGRAKGV